jgi:hypothetical protein
MKSSLKRKSVRFAVEDSLCDYRQGPEELTTEIIRETWLQPEDFDEFRSDARNSSRNAIKKGLAAYIKWTYGHSDNKTQDMLNLWARCSDTRRGLERFINEDYAKVRLYVRRKTVRAILYTQERLRKEEEQSYDRASAVIGNVSTTLSADPIKLAIMLGKADYAAVVRRRVTVVRRIASARTKRPPRSSQSPHQFHTKDLDFDCADDGSHTIHVVPVSSQQRREKKDKLQLLQLANLDRREVRRRVTVVTRVASVRTKRHPRSSQSPQQFHTKDLDFDCTDDGSHTIPVVPVSSQQKKDKLHLLHLLQLANLNRREITLIQ